MWTPLAILLQDTPTDNPAADGAEAAVKEPLNSREWLEVTQSNITDWFQNSAPDWIEKLALFVGIVLVTRLIGGWVANLLGRALNNTKPKATQLMRSFAVSITRKAFLLLGIVLGLDSIGIAVAPFLAGFGVAGIAIGFALKDTMSNFAAGVMILFYHPFEVGDWIDAGGSAGKVDAMNLSYTTLLTGDNQRIIVPNSKIWGGTITNVTANPKRRLEITTAVARGQNTAAVESVLKRIAESHPLVFQDPAPAIKINELTDTAANYILRVWCPTSDFAAVRWDLLREIQAAFEEEKIRPPVQRREVHMHQVTG